MMRWMVAAALVAASVGGTAADAAPKSKTKPWREVYEVYLSQMWATSSPGARCSEAPAGGSKSVRKVVMKGHGHHLSARLSGYVGSWEVAIYDSKGKRMGFSGGTGIGNVQSTAHAYHYSDKAEAYYVHVCHFAGLPHGVVTLTYTP